MCVQFSVGMRTAQNDETDIKDNLRVFVLQRIHDWKITSSAAPVLRVNFCTTSSSSTAESTDSAETLSRYADRPWEYLESEGKYDQMIKVQ